MDICVRESLVEVHVDIGWIWNTEEADDVDGARDKNSRPKNTNFRAARAKESNRNQMASSGTKYTHKSFTYSDYILIWNSRKSSKSDKRFTLWTTQTQYKINAAMFRIFAPKEFSNCEISNLEANQLLVSCPPFSLTIWFGRASMNFSRCGLLVLCCCCCCYCRW